MTLQDLEDRRAITDLLHRSALAIDDKDFVAMAACFTEDAVLDHGPEAATPILRGRDIIVGLATRTHDGSDSGRSRLASHHVGNVVVTFNSLDRASVDSYVHTFHALGDGTAGLVWGRWHDEVVRTADGWQIEARTSYVAGTQNFIAYGHPVRGAAIL
jgi:3-phenylpropionate/cinnamic acid dioxygenase small subunit